MQGLVNQRYRLLERLGSGSIGEVFRTEDRKLNRIVALKMLSKEFTQDEDPHYFRNEFSVLSKLHHPNIIEVHDFGYTADGRMFFTMEYLPGPNIKNCFKTHASYEWLCSATIQVVDALGYVHSRGLLHSDIKPQNILVIDEGTSAKLLDFSLTGPVDTCSPAMLGGTISYLAPELIKGIAVDHRADFYSLGVLLYEVVTGVQPFQDSDPLAIVRQHLEKEVVPPSGHKKDIPKKLEEIILTLMQKEAHARYSSAEELVEALAGVLEKKLEARKRPRVLLEGGLVGRAHVLEEIQRAYSLTKDGKGSFVLITGEAGIGKSRLLKELEFRCRLDKVLSVSCTPARGSIIEQLVRQIYTALQREHPKLIQQYSAQLRKLIHDMDQNPFPDSVTLRHTAELPDVIERKRFLMQLVRFVADASRFLKPLVMLIDDLHLANEEDCIFLSLLGRAVQSKGVFSLMTSGNGLFQSGVSLVDELEDGFLTQIALQGLSLADTGHLIRSILGDTNIDQVLADRIHSATKGNPFLVKEMLNELIHAGILVPGHRSWELHSARLSSDTSHSMGRYGLVASRLRRMTKRSLGVLRAASVIGQEFTLEILVDSAGLAERTTYSAIKEGLHSGFIREHRSNGKLGYRFVHASYRQMLHDQVRPSLRQSLHLRAGLFLEKKHRQSLDGVLEKLAYHFGRSSDLSKATRYLVMAGDKAAARHFNQEAIRHYEEARRFGESIWHDPKKAVIAERLGHLYRINTDYEVSVNRYTEALTIYFDHDDYLKVGQLCRDIGLVYEKLARFEDALKYYRFGLSTIAGKDLSQKLGFLGKIGWIYYLMGKNRQALKIGRRVLRMAEKSRNEKEISHASSLLGVTQMYMGNWETAKDSLKRGLLYKKKSGDQYGVVRSYNNLGLLDYNAGELEGALASFRRALKVAKKTGDIDGVTMVTNNLGLVFKEKGLWSRARRCFHDSRKVWDGLGVRADVALSFLNLGGVCERIGQTKRAKAFYLKSLRIGREQGNSRLVGDSCENLGRMLLEDNDIDDAFSYLETSRTEFEKIRYKAGTTRLSGLFAEYHLARGEGVKALQEVSQLSQGSELSNSKIFEAYANRVSGRVYGVLGRRDEAKACFARSIGTYRRLGMIYQLAKTLFLSAKTMSARGNIPSSECQLLEARKLCEKLGLKRELSEIQVIFQNQKEGHMELPKKPGRLASLYRISKTLNSILDLKSLLTKVMDLVNTELKAERGLILLKDDRKGKLTPMVARNLEKKTIRDATEVSYSVIKEVLSGGSPILSSNIAEDPRFRKSKSIPLYKIRSLMCVPLRAWDKVIGTIYVDSRTSSHIFDEEDLKFLTSLANLAAIAIENARLHSELVEECETLRDELTKRHSFEDIWGSSRKMQEVCQLVERVAPTVVPILIQGETGTGKELIATAIHNCSKRSKKPFVPINCGAIPQQLLESELFGHMRGAFTGAVKNKPGLFEEADGGTIFFDEIGEMNPELQHKLLRVLEDGEMRRVGGTKNKRVDVRVISATHKDLEKEVETGAFRKDLFYRLNVLTLRLPPIRERRQDIPLMASRFLKRFAKREERNISGFVPEVMDSLVNYDWPGNVRELQNEIERAVVLVTGRWITLDVISDKLKVSITRRIHPRIKNLKETMKKVEKEFIQEVLARHKGNRTRAARSLGISRQSLHSKLATYKIATRSMSL